MKKYGLMLWRDTDESVLSEDGTIHRDITLLNLGQDEIGVGLCDGGAELAVLYRATLPDDGPVNGDGNAFRRKVVGEP